MAVLTGVDLAITHGIDMMLVRLKQNARFDECSLKKEEGLGLKIQGLELCLYVTTYLESFC